MMDVRFKLGCKKIESMKARINGICFCGFKKFRMGDKKER